MDEEGPLKAFWRGFRKYVCAQANLLVGLLLLLLLLWNSQPEMTKYLWCFNCSWSQNGSRFLALKGHQHTHSFPRVIALGGLQAVDWLDDVSSVLVVPWRCWWIRAGLHIYSPWPHAVVEPMTTITAAAGTKSRKHMTPNLAIVWSSVTLQIFISFPWSCHFPDNLKLATAPHPKSPIIRKIWSLAWILHPFWALSVFVDQVFKSRLAND